MPKSPKGDVGCDVHVAVDEKHKLLVQELTNAVTDVDQLGGIAIQAKGALGVDQLNVVADMGYYHGDAIKTCEEAGIEPYVAKPLTSANRKLGFYGKEQFTCEPEQDCYRCPARQTLTCRFDTPLRLDAIFATMRPPPVVPVRSRGIVHGKEGRRITRWVREAILERMQKRVETHPEVMKRRKQMVEHPFGTIEHWRDQGYFLPGLQPQASRRASWGSPNAANARLRERCGRALTDAFVWQRLVYGNSLGNIIAA